MTAGALMVVIGFEEAPWARVIAMRDGDACRAGEWAVRHRQDAIDALDAAIEAACAECRDYVYLDDLRRAA